jgi:hypothetical protein
MSDTQSGLRGLFARLTAWWNSSAKNARQRGTDGADGFKREATARAQQAADKLQDFRASDAGQKAAGKLNDLRGSETAKRAEAALKDLRTSDAGQKATSALSDLRQREPVKKAEESARKVMHDLFSGGNSGTASGE